MARNGLTPNMSELLERLVQGETVADIAGTWNVTPRMVQKTAAAARQALGAKTLPHAVALWLGRNGHGS